MVPIDNYPTESSPNHPAPLLTLTPEHLEQMRRHVALLAPQEACGLVAGQADRAHLVIPITNQLHSTVRFYMAPDEQLRAFIHMDELGLELIAIYHSHPGGPSHPSVTDVTEAYYPEAMHVIWHPGPNGWSCKGFTIREGVVQEARIQVTEIE
jgi:proteasome lid subunit RPN8/RPN11